MRFAHGEFYRHTFSRTTPEGKRGSPAERREQLEAPRGCAEAGRTAGSGAGRRSGGVRLCPLDAPVPRPGTASVPAASGPTCPQAHTGPSVLTQLSRVHSDYPMRPPPPLTPRVQEGNVTWDTSALRVSVHLGIPVPRSASPSGSDGIPYTLSNLAHSKTPVCDSATDGF